MRTFFYETQFEIGSKAVLVFAEYTLTGGCPAHMGSMSYAGHPAEPAELEFVKVEINTTDADHKTADPKNYFPAPDWLESILQNDDDIYQDVVGGHDDGPDPDDYHDDRD